MNGIAYQNKDVASKSLAEGLKDKSLEAYGIHLPKIIDVQPTNLPAIMANELRLDNLFQFEDGSYGIIDYESQFNENDKIKYLNYLARVLKRLENENGFPKVHMIVIYTCNVANVNTEMDIGCLHLTIKAGYLCNINTKKVFRKLKYKILYHKPLSDKELMLMIVLPLTRSTIQQQKKWLQKTIELAKMITNEQQQIFILSGILTFSDKIIENDYAEEIRRWIQMTKVAQIFEREKQEAITEAISKILSEKNEAVTILRVLLKGNSLTDIAEKTGISEQEIQELIK